MKTISEAIGHSIRHRETVIVTVNDFSKALDDVKSSYTGGLRRLITIMAEAKLLTRADGMKTLQRAKLNSVSLSS